MLLTTHAGSGIPFVGRAVELDELSSQVALALSGQPKLVFVRGEAGVGKTRLLRELGTLVQRLGVQVVHGRASDAAATPLLAFAPLLDLCSSRVGDGPEIDRLGRPNMDDPARDGARRLGAVVRSVIEQAKRDPMLVVLDDLHWGDAATLELLGQLVFAVADHAAAQHHIPLMIVVAHRPVPPNDGFGKLAARLHREQIACVLELDGLAIEETRALLVGMGLGSVTERLLGRVQSATHGSPLFIHELVSQLDRQGLLERSSHAATVRMIPEDTAWPRDASDALGQRLVALEENEIRLLTLAALVGDTISLERMSRLARVERAVLAATFEHALQVELLAVESGALRFRHPLIRELLAGRAGPLERPALHLQIAEQLEHETPSASLSLEIAEHLLAAQSGDARKLLKHALAGAEHASSMFAWAEAARLFAAAAAAAASSMPELAANELGALHLRCGKAFFRAFDHAASSHYCSEATRAFARSGDKLGYAVTLELQLWAKYSAGVVRYGEPLDVGEYLELLSSLGEGDLNAQGLLLEALATAHWLNCQTEQAELAARRSLAISEQVADYDLRAQANFTLGLILLQADNPRLAFDHFSASRSQRQRLGDAWACMPPLQGMCELQIVMGCLLEAEQLCEETAKLASEVQYIWGLSATHANQAALALARGQLESVEEHAAKAILWSKRASYGNDGARALCTLARARILRGEREDALYAAELLVRSGEIFDAPSRGAQLTFELWRVFIDVNTGGGASHEESSERLAQCARLIEQSPPDNNSAFLMCMLIESAARLAPALNLEFAHQRLARRFDMGNLLTSTGAFLLPRVLAISARLLGDSIATERYATEAIAVAERIGATLELGLSLAEHSAWLAQHAPSEQTRARNLGERAHAVLSELGIERASQTQANLSAREQLVLRLIAQGRTDRQIANELMVRDERVPVLLAELYTKLDVDGPGLATAYAFAYGIGGQRDASTLPQHRFVMVSDMVDFTGFVRRLGDLHARALIRTHNRVIRQSVTQHRGNELAHTGDGVIAAFHTASDAITCAIDVQQRFAAFCAEHPQTPIRVRIGLNAGQLIPHGESLFGAALIAAVRVCSRAQAGQILMSGNVHELADSQARTATSSLGEALLKGFDQPVPLYELRYA